jgi:choice-of-anchor B domain-containing protein
MKPFLLFSLIMGSAIMLSAQISQNMALWSQWDDDMLPSSGGLTYNDIWGYADAIGNEYAILGSLKMVHFINVSNPANPVEVVTLTPGSSSIWRDFKTYGTYAYGVADQGSEGLLVMDLSNLPASVTLTNQLTSEFTRAHNIFIDVSNGRLYVAGSNTRNQGLWVYDIATDPANPTVLGSPVLFNFAGPSNSYVHDLYVEDNIAYCSHGFSGIYSYNFLNPATPYALQGIPTGGYNHSSWMIPGGQYLVYAQEVPKGMPLVIIDLLDDMGPVASFKEPLLAPDHMDNTPHNPFVKGNLIYTSYYEDGVQVFNISNINNPVRVAYYDTEPDNTTYSGTNNNWGIYPYLPSGNIIASDTEHGLFILQLQAGALPVEWLSFDATTGRGGIRLSWATASEINNESFDIERSSDGRDFNPIGKLEGRGTVQVISNYSFLDTDPHEGTNYYRIRQKDFDGNAAYSKIVAAQWQSCKSIDDGIAIAANIAFPLPSPLRYHSGTASFWSIEGRRIAEYNWQPGDEVLYPAGQIKPALYFVQYQSACGVEVQKALITR